MQAPYIIAKQAELVELDTIPLWSSFNGSISNASNALSSGSHRLLLAALWQLRLEMAEREGFEPSVELPPHILSRDAQSATLSPLLCREFRNILHPSLGQ